MKKKVSSLVLYHLPSARFLHLSLYSKSGVKAYVHPTEYPLMTLYMGALVLYI